MSTITLNTTLKASPWHRTPTASVGLNDWLFDQDSLTKRLTQLCRDSFTVQLLAEGWHSLSEDECLTLNLAQGSCGWVREVLLCDGQRPWVFARSVASQAELQASDFDISQLGTRSLGELLFSHQAFSRGALHICQMPCPQLPVLAQQHAINTPQLWARRSCFQNKALRVLVAEVFLPHLWHDTGHSDFTSL